MELLSLGIKLEVSEDLTDSPTTWRNLYGLSEVPDMGGEKEKVDVTTLADKNKRYIDGIWNLSFFTTKKKRKMPKTVPRLKRVMRYCGPMSLQRHR